MIDTEHNLPSPQTQDYADHANPPPNVPALQKRLSEIIEEYETKFSNIDAEVSAFERAGDRLKSAAAYPGRGAIRELILAAFTPLGSKKAY